LRPPPRSSTTAPSGSARINAAASALKDCHIRRSLGSRKRRSVALDILTFAFIAVRITMTRRVHHDRYISLENSLILQSCFVIYGLTCKRLLVVAARWYELRPSGVQMLIPAGEDNLLRISHGLRAKAAARTIVLTAVTSTAHAA
jgi:hypothetical protein